MLCRSLGHLVPPFSVRRNLTLESLEERELLSVSPLTYPASEETSLISSDLGNATASGDDAESGDYWIDQWILQIERSFLDAAPVADGFTKYLAEKGVTVLDSLGSPGMYLVEVDAETLTGQSEILAGLDGLEFWQPNYVIVSTGVAQEVNDPLVDQQWALDTIDVTDAWQVSDGSGVVVAVLDSGITLTHPDLKGNIWINTAEITGDGKDNDNNGYIDDINGWNFVSGTANVTDNDGHGTHVAGIIGAVAGNGIGGTGAAPGVQILPLKVINGSTGSTATIVAAMNYLLDLKDRGVNIAVANMSLGYYSEDLAVRQAIERAGEAGVVVVTSAGNNSRNNDNTQHFPSEYTTQLDNVIAVASVDQYGQLASNSNYGLNSVDLAAPGVSIYSTTKNGGYGYMTGTSMAAPFVSAAAAILAAGNSSLTPAEIKTQILDATMPLASVSGKIATGGILSIGGLFFDVNNSPPGIPTNLSITGINGNNITFRWNDNSSTETGFEIQASIDGGQTWTVTATGISANLETYTTTFQNGTVSLFRIRAVNEHGNSAWSNIVSTGIGTPKKPSAPTGVKATVTDHQGIVVSWKAVSTATAYRVVRTLSTKGEWEEVYFGSDLSFADTGLDSDTKYFYRVYAVNMFVSSAAGSTVSATTMAVLPDSPGGVSAALLDATTVTVTWNAVTHAASYRVECYDAVRDRWLTVGKTTTVAVTHRNLDPSTTYRYRVVAVSGAGESAASGTVEIVTPIAVPAAPTGLKGTVVDATTVQLQWTGNARAASYRIEYSLTRKTNSWTTRAAGGTSTTYTAENLAAGFKQYFRVVAVNTSGDSTPSAVYSVTLPPLVPEGPPASVTAEAESNTKVLVAWTAVQNATKYVVERSTDGKTWKKVKTVAATETEVLITGHKASTEYYYRVTAVSSAGSSDPSEIVAVTTRFPAPSAPRLKVLGSDTIQVTWNVVSGAVGYRIERAVEGTILWDTVTETTSDAKSFIDRACDANTVYLYRIVALGTVTNIESAASNSKSARTAPVPPTGLAVGEASAKQVTLTWNETDGAVRYIVQRFDGTVWKNAGTTKTNEITVKSLKSETEYDFRIIAVGNDGQSLPGQKITVRTSLGLPTKVGGLKVAAMDADSVSLTWNAVALAASYTVQQYDSAAKTWITVADSITATAYIDTGLNAVTLYKYRVFAVNESGPGQVASGNATTLKASVGTTAPGDVELVSASKNILKLLFEAPEEGVQTYRIQWSTDGVTWTSQKTFSTSQGAAVLNGLKSGSVYHVRIRLETGKIISDWSDAFQFSTL